jgi:hypothetical protein
MAQTMAMAMAMDHNVRVDKLIHNETTLPRLTCHSYKKVGFRKLKNYYSGVQGPSNYHDPPTEQIHVSSKYPMSRI